MNGSAYSCMWQKPEWLLADNMSLYFTYKMSQLIINTSRNLEDLKKVLSICILWRQLMRHGVTFLCLRSRTLLPWCPPRCWNPNALLGGFLSPSSVKDWTPAFRQWLLVGKRWQRAQIITNRVAPIIHLRWSYVRSCSWASWLLSICLPRRKCRYATTNVRAARDIVRISKSIGQGDGVAEGFWKDVVMFVWTGKARHVLASARLWGDIL